MILRGANRDQDDFGAERLADSIHRHRHLPANDLVSEVVKEVSEYSKLGVHIDDKVLMVVKVLDPPEEMPEQRLDERKLPTVPTKLSY